MLSSLWGERKSPGVWGEELWGGANRVPSSPPLAPAVPTVLPRAPGFLRAPARAARGVLQMWGCVNPNPGSAAAARSWGGAWRRQPVLPHGQLRRGDGCARVRPAQLVPSPAAFPRASAAAALPPRCPAPGVPRFPSSRPGNAARQRRGSLVRTCRAGREAGPRHAGEQQKL